MAKFQSESYKSSETVYKEVLNNEEDTTEVLKEKEDSVPRSMNNSKSLGDDGITANYLPYYIQDI